MWSQFLFVAKYIDIGIMNDLSKIEEKGVCVVMLPSKQIFIGKTNKTFRWKRNSNKSAKNFFQQSIKMEPIKHDPTSLGVLLLKKLNKQINEICKEFKQEQNRTNENAK